jgi:hypothetical protein
VKFKLSGAYRDRYVKRIMLQAESASTYHPRIRSDALFDGMIEVKGMIFIVFSTL